MGQRLFETGGSGIGHAMKALNNFIAGTNFLAAAEALVVGRRFGLDPALMMDIINQSTGRNFSTEHVLPQQVLSRKFASGFQLGLLAKDVKIAADLAEDLQAHAPLAQLSRDLLARAKDRLGGDADHSAAIRYWEMLNGVTVGARRAREEMTRRSPSFRGRPKAGTRNPSFPRPIAMDSGFALRAPGMTVRTRRSK